MASVVVPVEFSTPAKYGWHCIVLHHGSSLHNGHYSSVIAQNNVFYHINDEQVIPINQNRLNKILCSSAPYVILYSRTEGDHASNQIESRSDDISIPVQSVVHEPSSPHVVLSQSQSVLHALPSPSVVPSQSQPVLHTLPSSHAAPTQSQSVLHTSSLPSIVGFKKRHYFRRNAASFRAILLDAYGQIEKEKARFRRYVQKFELRWNGEIFVRMTGAKLIETEASAIQFLQQIHSKGILESKRWSYQPDLNHISRICDHLFAR